MVIDLGLDTSLLRLLRWRMLLLISRKDGRLTAASAWAMQQTSGLQRFQQCSAINHDMSKRNGFRIYEDIQWLYNYIQFLCRLWMVFFKYPHDRWKTINFWAVTHPSPKGNGIGTSSWRKSSPKKRKGPKTVSKLSPSYEKSALLLLR